MVLPSSYLLVSVLILGCESTVETRINVVGRGGYARLALRTRGLGTRVPRSNPGAATFALFVKLRKRDFRRPHPQV